jgi:hypothetical protein
MELVFIISLFRWRNGVSQIGVVVNYYILLASKKYCYFLSASQIRGIKLVETDIYATGLMKVFTE